MRFQTENGVLIAQANGETKYGVWRDEVVSGTQAGPDTTVKQLFGYE